jgi:uncharacterized membrane protein
LAPLDQVIFVLTLLAALGCGLVAGVFFAFSTFVMRALARLAPHQGIAAMQSVNVVVINPWFMTAFLGTAVLCIALLILSLLRWHAASTACVLAGAVLYLVGTLLVTIVFNVPKNETLGKVAPADPGSVPLWGRYVAEWTRWNHVRTAAALAAAAAFSIALAY